MGAIPYGTTGLFSIRMESAKYYVQRANASEKTRFSKDTIRRNRSPVCQVDDRNSTGHGLTWVRKPVKELREGQPAGVAENNSGREDVAGLRDNYVQRGDTNAHTVSSSVAWKV